MQRKYVINCPYCDAEYLLGEIFVPKFVFGNVSNIIKDKEGKILSYDGEELDTDETYECDVCKKRFSVSLLIKTKVDKPEDFSEQFETPITTRMTLFEDL